MTRPTEIDNASERGHEIKRGFRKQKKLLDDEQRRMLGTPMNGDE